MSGHTTIENQTVKFYGGIRTCAHKDRLNTNNGVEAKRNVLAGVTMEQVVRFTNAATYAENVLPGSTIKLDAGKSGVIWYRRWDPNPQDRL